MMPEASAGMPMSAYGLQAKMKDEPGYAQAEAFLRDNGIDFVISGPAEAAHSASPQPLRFSMDAVTGQATVLYRVPVSSGAIP